MARRRKKARLGKTGCLFWIFILLVILVVFLYRGKGSLKETFNSFKEKLTKKPYQENILSKEKEGEKNKLEDNKGSIDKEKPGMTDQLESDKVLDSYSEEEEKTLKKLKTTELEQKKEEKIPKEAMIKNKTLEVTIYFVKINNVDGTAKPIPVTKTIEYKDSPITNTINALLKGPTEAEKQRGIISLIPEGTSLISTQLKDGYLTLNFSSNFEENYSGTDAIFLELSQVILTSLDFQQVNKMSILIEGKRKSYITGEGIPLKEVYTKNDLPLFKTGG